MQGIIHVMAKARDFMAKREEGKKGRQGGGKEGGELAISNLKTILAMKTPFSLSSTKHSLSGSQAGCSGLLGGIHMSCRCLASGPRKLQKPARAFLWSVLVC